MSDKETDDNKFWWGIALGIIGGAVAAAVVSNAQQNRSRNNQIPKDPLLEMRAIVSNSQQDFSIREAAARITSRCISQDSICEISSIFSFVANEIKYMSDPARADRFSHPLETLKLRIGDCDCKSILLASLLETIGHVTELVVIPGHVFVQVQIENTDLVKLPPNAYHIQRNGKLWVPLESTASGTYIGWMSQNNYDAVNLGSARYG